MEATMTNKTQGPWTRIRPLQIDEVDDKTAAAMKAGELTWGGSPNNLIKVIAYCPRLAHTEEEYAKLLHLHEHEKYPNIYTGRERVVLDYTVKVTRDAHLVSDQEFAELRSTLAKHNREDTRLKRLDEPTMDRHVDTQIVELTWLIGMFCLLNRWFTALQVPDEGPKDEDDFQAAYEQTVPQDIRDRNAKILGRDF